MSVSLCQNHFSDFWGHSKKIFFSKPFCFNRVQKSYVHLTRGNKGTVPKASVAYALAIARAEAPVPDAYADDYKELKEAYDLAKKSEESTKLLKDMDKALDEKARERYSSLTDEEILDLLINRKWYYTIGNGIYDLYAAISHQLADRIIELSKRYEDTLPELIKKASDYEDKVKSHLERMGFKW